MYYYFWMITWMKNVNNFQLAKVQPQGSSNFSLALLIKRACNLLVICYLELRLASLVPTTRQNCLSESTRLNSKHSPLWTPSWIKRISPIRIMFISNKNSQYHITQVKKDAQNPIHVFQLNPTSTTYIWKRRKN